MSGVSLKIDIAILVVAAVSLYLSSSIVSSINKGDTAKAKTKAGWIIALSAAVVLGVGFVIYDTKKGGGTYRQQIASQFGL